MSVLTGPAIKEEIEKGNISVDPYIPENVGENAIDLRLGPALKSYPPYLTLDMRKEPPVDTFAIPEDGFKLKAGVLYLGHTLETIHSSKYMSHISGRSSVGRLGLTIHCTAGVIDIGFNGQITLEMVVVNDLIIYPNVRICQLIFEQVVGDIILYQGRYNNQKGPVISLGSDQKFGSFSEPRTNIR